MGCGLWLGWVVDGVDFCVDEVVVWIIWVGK